MSEKPSGGSEQRTEGHQASARQAPRPDKPLRRELVVAESTLLYGAVLAIAGLPAFGAGWGALHFDNPLVLTTALIYLPFIPYAQGRISLRELGLGRAGFGKSLRAALWVALACFPIFLLLWYGAGGRLLGIPPMRSPSAPFPYAPAEWARLVATQFLAVAVPEEWFFRGYLQERLARLWPRKIGAGRLSLSVGAILGAFLFGLAHAVRFGSPVRMNVAVPGLLLAWVRERGEHLAGPVLLHAFSNLLLFAFVSPMS